MDAKMLSERIRMRRKQVKEEGVENMVDTAALPQMNPQDVWNMEKMAQHEETIENAVSPRVDAQSPVMEEPQENDSQSMEVLKKHMSRIGKILGRLSMSR